MVINRTGCFLIGWTFITIVTKQGFQLVHGLVATGFLIGLEDLVTGPEIMTEIGDIDGTGGLGHFLITFVHDGRIVKATLTTDMQIDTAALTLGQPCNRPGYCLQRTTAAPAM